MSSFLLERLWGFTHRYSYSFPSGMLFKLCALRALCGEEYLTNTPNAEASFGAQVHKIGRTIDT